MNPIAFCSWIDKKIHHLMNILEIMISLSIIF
jgi:hypothetical protein